MIKHHSRKCDSERIDSKIFVTHSTGNLASTLKAVRSAAVNVLHHQKHLRVLKINAEKLNHIGMSQFTHRSRFGLQIRVADRRLRPVASVPRAQSPIGPRKPSRMHISIASVFLRARGEGVARRSRAGYSAAVSRRVGRWRRRHHRTARKAPAARIAAPTTAPTTAPAMTATLV
jgi:hypothetical protein